MNTRSVYATLTKRQQRALQAIAEHYSRRLDGAKVRPSRVLDKAITLLVDDVLADDRLADDLRAKLERHR